MEKNRVLFVYLEDLRDTGFELRIQCFRDISVLSFKIGREDKLGNYDLPHSLAATPGKYILASIEKLMELEQNTDFYAILNPGVECSSISLTEVRDGFYQQSQRAESGIICGWNGIPAGYFFSKKILLENKSNLMYLSFLSTYNASIDAALLKKIFHTFVVVKQFDFPLHLVRDGSFYLLGLENILTLTALQAIRYLDGDKKGRKIAYMPYHAGDILFFCIALRNTQTFFDYLMVNREFVNIVNKILPEKKVLIVEETSPGRGINFDHEYTTHMNIENHYFMEVATRYFDEHDLIYYFRQIRNYNVARTHMISQWEFSMPDQSKNLPFASSAPHEFNRIKKGKSILIHFDGGWLLKVFPKFAQVELITLLEAQGYRVSILANETSQYNVPTFRFENLAQLEGLILDHALFLGMDSFPAHFSTHVLKQPTLCLFSSTRPENSNNLKSRSYQFTSKNMNCNPCYGTESCPRFGLDYCKNFSDVNEVMRAINQLYEDCYG